MKYKFLLPILLVIGISSFTACKRYDPAGELLSQRGVASYAYLQTTVVKDLALKDLQRNDVLSSKFVHIERSEGETLSISFERDRLMQYVDHLAGELEVFNNNNKKVNLARGKKHSLLVLEKQKGETKTEEGTEPADVKNETNTKSNYEVILLEDNLDEKKDSTKFGIRVVFQKDSAFFADYPQYEIEAREKLAPDEDKENNEEDIPHEPYYGTWQTLLDFSKDGRSDSVAYRSDFVYFEPTRLDTFEIEIPKIDRTENDSVKNVILRSGVQHLEVVLRNRTTTQVEPVSQFILKLDTNKAKDLYLTIVVRPNLKEDGDSDENTDYATLKFENLDITLFDHRYKIP